MVKEAYCSFEVAKMLKEKGFDGESYGIYIDENTFEELDFKSSNTPETSIYRIVAPTHQMAMKWLREEHNLYIEIFVTWRDKISHYQWRINNLITQDTIVDTPCLEKPEEAVEAALKYCLEKMI